VRLNLFALASKPEELKAELPSFFEYWEGEVAKAEPIFELEGSRLEVIARGLPHHQAVYSQFAIEARGLVKWLENEKARIEARYLKNYHTGNARALGVREQAQYLQGEKEVVEMNQLIIQTALYQGHFDEIVEAIKQIGWMIGHITKLRVAELQDVVL
jgi:hypothetical protein